MMASPNINGATSSFDGSRVPRVSTLKVPEVVSMELGPDFSLPLDHKSSSPDHELEHNASLCKHLNDTQELVVKDIQSFVNDTNITTQPQPKYTQIILLDASCRILQVSDSFLTQYNLASEECIGADVFNLFTTLNLIQANTLHDTIEKAITSGTFYPLATEGDASASIIRAIPIFENGSLFHVALEMIDAEVNVSATTDQLDTNDTYRILVETVKDYAIFMLDPEGKVRTWNAGAEALKGYQPKEVIGRHFSIFYSREDIISEKPRKELDICLRDGKVEDEGWRYRKDGTRFWANVIITCVYRNGTHIGFSKVTRDLTERKAAESRVISAYEEASKMKSAFLANMSHEIRTPMHGMLSALTLLLDTELTKDQRDLGNIIQESGCVLLQVINDILEFSKLASGTFSITSDPMSIQDIVVSVGRSFIATLPNGVRLETSFSDELPKSGIGDPLRYRQIIQNLLSNAVKFTESGSIKVNVSLKAEDDQASIILTEITDTGIGVPESAVDALFTPFTQFDASATKRYRGTGLGLSICKGLAELTGGSIGFRPNPDGGSIFWFTTRLEKLARPSLEESLAADLRKAVLVTSIDRAKLVREIAPKKRLLLAEDNHINQRVMLMMLKGLGFEKIDIAIDGAEAVELVRQHPLSYDLILMDISMPVLDGLGATSRIRELELEVPIVAMTANALKDDADEYLAKGMNDVVPKPVDRQLLLKVFLDWL